MIINCKKITDLFPGRGSDMPLLRTTALKPSSPLLHKETPPASRQTGEGWG